ncbi:MAG: hypothetical protein WD557_08375 [Dehalococcoidia bacterium]
MKVLFLGNSSEVYGDVDASGRRGARAAEALEAEFGEPVEMLVRRIWPTPALPGAIEKWMAGFQPDIVYLNVVSFWFNYESVPLRLERVLGRAGKPLKSAGIKASQVPWLGHTAAFHWLRERCQKVIGGATFFEPDQVTSVISDCARTIVRQEDVVLVIKGPRGQGRHNGLKHSRAWAEERRQYVHGALQRLCAELHVDYVGAQEPRYLTDPLKDVLGDRLHRGSEGHARSGDEIAAILSAAWERQRSSVHTG